MFYQGSVGKNAPSPAEQWDTGWGLLLRGGWRQPYVPGFISHPSSSLCAGWCKSSVSFGAGGTVTALSLVTLLPALPGPTPALEQLSLQTCHLPRGDSEGLVLLGVAVEWLLLTSKSQVWGHPYDTSGVSCPSWQLGPCLAMPERAGTEPSHCPQPLSPATVPTARGCVHRSHTGTAIWWHHQRGRGDCEEDRSLQGPRSRRDFCSTHASRLTFLQGTWGQQDQGDNPPPSDLPFLEDRD